MTEASLMFACQHCGVTITQGSPEVGWHMERRCSGATTPWDSLQREVSLWAIRNFGDNPVWMPMLGLVEEVGEYYAAEEQGLRPKQLDAIGDQVIYVLALCEKIGLKFGSVVSHGYGTNQLTPKELMGVLGACCQAVLKTEQAIRGFTWARRRDQMLVCLAVWHRWVAAECTTLGVGLHEVVTDVWADVRMRDWVKNPSDANKVRGGSEA